jgi:hypothetical protein
VLTIDKKPSVLASSISFILCRRKVTNHIETVSVHELSYGVDGVKCYSIMDAVETLLNNHATAVTCEKDLQ